MSKTKKIVEATFSDGVAYDLIRTADCKFETMIDNDENFYKPIFSRHDTLDEALKFIKDWSEEILKEVAE